MPLSPRDRGLGCGFAFLFLFVVGAIADIAAIRLLGRNASSTFQYVGTSVRSPNPAPVPVSLEVAPAPRPVETVEVPVVAKDLPVGTVLTEENGSWVAKTVRKNELPPGAVVRPADLTDKRLIRAMRAGEVFAATDLSHGLTLPKDTDLVTHAIDPRAVVNVFFVPGARVDVIAVRREGDRLKVFRLLEDVLIVSVETSAGAEEMARVGFALTEKQTLALELARIRKCEFSYKLRNAKPDADGYDLDAVLTSLENGLPAVAPPPRPVGENR